MVGGERGSLSAPTAVAFRRDRRGIAGQGTAPDTGPELVVSPVRRLEFGVIDLATP